MTKEKLVLAKDLLERINDLDYLIRTSDPFLYVKGSGGNDVKLQLGDFNGLGKTHGVIVNALQDLRNTLQAEFDAM